MLKRIEGCRLELVVTYVNKSDKSLIYWYEKGSGMKRALRCVGIDKRTAAMVEKKKYESHGRGSESGIAVQSFGPGFHGWAQGGAEPEYNNNRILAEFDWRCPTPGSHDV